MALRSDRCAVQAENLISAQGNGPAAAMRWASIGPWENCVLRTRIEGEQYLHRLLWIATQRQLKHANKEPTGALYDYLSAMVFAFLSLEAYLNFVGERLTPDSWGRRFEKLDVKKKITKVFELCRLSELQADDPLYRRIIDLKNLRNAIAHAKSIKFVVTVEHSEDTLPQDPETFLDLNVTPTNARIAVEAVEQFATIIHNAAREQVMEKSWFGKTPFNGPLRQSTGHTRLAS